LNRLRFVFAVVVLGGGFPGACRLPAAEPAPVSYANEVVPLLRRYCTHCHGGDRPKANLALDRHADEAAARRDRTTWEKVQRSLRAGDMPPAGSKQPTAAERDLLRRFLGGQLTAGPRDPGRVTLRRLNRTEYNNTIRDLLGVDLQPAEDFPPDDIGYGFDTIGDVLSLAPVLMERYLAAAERVVAAALGEEGVTTSAYRFQPTELRPPCKPGDLARGFRAVPAGGELVLPPVPSPRACDYVVRVRAHGPGGEAVRLALHLDGRTVRVVDVKADAAQPRVHEFRVRLEEGPHTLGLRHEGRGPEPQSPSRSLFVQLVEVEPLLAGAARPVPRPPTYVRLMTCQPGQGLSKDDCARRVLGAFARRAFRRPVLPGEVERLVGLVHRAEQAGESFEKGIALALQAVLVSPHFLFRVERDPPPGVAAHLLSEHELATRLSYFLWSTTPDDELAGLADRGQLRGRLEDQVRRLLRDPRSKALAENFGGQWLEIRNLTARTPDTGMFPQFTPALRSAMVREAELFVGAVIAEERSIFDLLDADFTYVDETLARHYGIPGVRGPEFRRVPPPGGGRGGVLTLAAVLTVTSNPTRTSPVKRGKWILENLLNSPPPPPPPDAGELRDDAQAVGSGSLRQRLEQHRTRTECASCHARMDPLGFGLENFDAVGAWREREGKFAIDPSGSLPTGETFRGPAELKKLLRGRGPAFRRCLTEKLLTYALGRGLEASDGVAVETILRALEKDGDQFSKLVLELVKSDPFQMRRGPGQK
jgi:hypothetical protein